MNKYKDSKIGKNILEMLFPKLEKAVDKFGYKLSIMEVCGTHTVSISKTGIRDILSPYINLKSGPGCPVCVTDQWDIDCMLELAKYENVIIATFGDMVYVPGSSSSLMDKKASGADVRVVYSALDAVKIAEDNPDKDVVFLGVGFETTIPTIAASLQAAENKSLRNFYLYSAHKVVPPAIKVLLTDPEVKIDGFILPGHVSVILGRKPWDFLADDYSCPSSVVGFEAVDILLGIDNIVDQLLNERVEVANMYPRVVKEEGNVRAKGIMRKYYEYADSRWRGIGNIPGSGLSLKSLYKEFDAKEKFELSPEVSQSPKGCACGDVLKGKILPYECLLFGNGCTPVSPVGPCMVSSEGACAAYFRYHRNLKEGVKGER